MARLKDRSFPHSFEGSHQLESRIDLFSLNVLFSDQAMPEIYILCHINYAYICTWMHANAREEERSGVRVQTESGTGERDTPHGRVKHENIDHASASHLAKPILRKVRLFCSLRGLLTKYRDLKEILSLARFIGMEWNAKGL